MIEQTLPNGLKIIVHRAEAASCVNIVLAVRAGSIHETLSPGSGTAHWVEHLLFDGCRKFPGDGIITEVSRLGGSFNAMTGLFRTEYTLSVSPKDTEKALEILGAMLADPEFLPEQIEHERSVIAREIDLYADDSDAVLEELLYASVYSGTPLADPVAGRLEVFMNAPASLAEKFFRQWYTPDRMVLAVTGPVTPDKLFACASEHLSGLQGRNPYRPELKLPEQDRKRRTVKKFPDHETSKIAVGFPFTGTDRKEFWAGNILASLLAWNSSSFLERELCRKRFLARDIAASLDGDGAWGIFRIEADCAPDNCRELEKFMTHAIFNFDFDGITAATLEAEKLRCSAMLRSESRDPAMLACRLAERATMPSGEILSDPFTDEAAIKAVTVDDLRRFAGDFIKPERLSTVILASDLRKTRIPGNVPANESYMPPAGIPPHPEPVFLQSPPLVFPGKNIFCTDRSGIADITVMLPCAGSRETAFGNGISQLACRVLDAGAARYSEEEWLARLDACAINLDTEFTSSALRLELSVPEENQDTAMEYLLELLTLPSWQKDVIRREAEILAEEWQSLESTGAKVFDRARELLFGEHPAGLPAGDHRIIRSITDLSLKKFYNGLWIPGGVTVGFGGSCSPVSAKSFLAALTSAIPWAAGTLPGDSIWHKPCCDQYSEVELDREQCVCVCMFPAPSLSETESLAAFKILDYAEGGLSGRLFQLIREKHHLAYSVETGTAPGFGCGAMYFSAGCEFSEAGKVIELFEQELQNITAGNIDREMFNRAKAEEQVVRKIHESNRINLCSRKTAEVFCGTESLGKATDRLTYSKFMDTVTAALSAEKKVFVKATDGK